MDPCDTDNSSTHLQRAGGFGGMGIKIARDRSSRFFSQPPPLAVAAVFDLRWRAATRTSLPLATTHQTFADSFKPALRGLNSGESGA